MAQAYEFLPISKEDMVERGWYYYDFLLITGDAYVDHPSFGTAVISRLLESQGYRVAICAQPEYHSPADLLAFGRPRYGALVNAGNIDSMVAHYSVAKRRREKDAYTPGGLAGKRPDRAVIVYSNLVKQAWPDLPIVIGGIEASLRRFAHYDYWEDKVRQSILVDSAADLLIYGMGEHQITEIAARLKQGQHPGEIRDVRGTCYMAKKAEDCPFPFVEEPSYEQVAADPQDYARAALIEHDEQDAVRGRAILQGCQSRWLVQTPPALPLETAELDAVADLPYTRTYHPSYEALGGVEAIREVEFSIIHNRGCYGACNFCALTMHQGRYVTARSHKSVLQEAEAMTQNPGFKGYIHDVGGPTANFRGPACEKQAQAGACAHRQCLFPAPCPSLGGDHNDYLTLLRKLRALPKVKKVFIRSGIRYDYMACDPAGEFFADLVRYHISGQLKVAPEHISPRVLYYMGKPGKEVYESFCEKYKRLNQKYGLEQYLVPYLMSSHPGSDLEDAVMLAEYLNETGSRPEQVQDFYPTPGTLSTAMYHTGLDPRTMEPVYVAKEPHEKAMQRALLQWKNPKNRALVLEALRKAGREDLIGRGKHCLVWPEGGYRSHKDGAPKPTEHKKVRGYKPPKQKNIAKNAAKAAQELPTEIVLPIEEMSQAPDKAKSYGKGKMPDKAKSYSKGKAPDKSKSYSKGEAPDKAKSYSKSGAPDRAKSYSKSGAPDKAKSYSKSEAPDKAKSYSKSGAPDKAKSYSKSEAPDKAKSYSQGKAPDKSRSYGKKQAPGKGPAGSQNRAGGAKKK